MQSSVDAEDLADREGQGVRGERGNCAADVGWGLPSPGVEMPSSIRRSSSDPYQFGHLGGGNAETELVNADALIDQAGLEEAAPPC